MHRDIRSPKSDIVTLMVAINLFVIDTVGLVYI